MRRESCCLTISQNRQSEKSRAKFSAHTRTGKTPNFPAIRAPRRPSPPFRYTAATTADTTAPSGTRTALLRFHLYRSGHHAQEAPTGSLRRRPSLATRHRRSCALARRRRSSPHLPPTTAPLPEAHGLFRPPARRVSPRVHTIAHAPPRTNERTNEYSVYRV